MMLTQARCRFLVLLLDCIALHRDSNKLIVFRFFVMQRELKLRQKCSFISGPTTLGQYQNFGHLISYCSIVPFVQQISFLFHSVNHVENRRICKSDHTALLLLPRRYESPSQRLSKLKSILLIPRDTHIHSLSPLNRATWIPWPLNMKFETWRCRVGLLRQTNIHPFPVIQI